MNQKIPKKKKSKVSKINLAYIAGIIDGEGCISIGKFKKQRYSSGWGYQLHVMVNNSDRKLCDFLKSHFEGSIHKYITPRKTIMWLWHVAAKKALQCLEPVLPYLRLKKSQAKIAIQFQKERIEGNKGKGKGRIKRKKVYFERQEKQRLILKSLKQVEKLT